MNKNPLFFSKESKEKELTKMFDHISPKYDFINHFLSFGIDIFWRKEVIKILNNFNFINKKNKNNIQKILDLATGTGDLAISLAKCFHHAFIIGLDPSKEMLKIAKNKIKDHSLEKQIKFVQGFSHKIPFEDSTFDLITISFGVRNFQFFHSSFKEIYRILKPMGILEILEFSKPSNFFIKNIYQFYSNFILPKIGSFFSKNDIAYQYLRKSIQLFPFCGKKMNKLLIFHGFHPVHIKKLTFGIVSIYLSQKNKII
ncbi:bifunctional demethylmenaquinone methyltransferase/2-methoxy-6-polyprenyl-1,4-benzoquinol methylase UbiE [Blattabacterium cuenoti]|uniref:bifunctional demethylmenaquinone methyltransferase/2-methoxy-6-polyprenyl-1,4-benzoquinol methylase UbiE n=1 Tax=Blattabacterium cuenoti TaxID=1653831 RepID=UPI00163BA1B0|nr:bifunctional demethylmenaquinone methyltransferase/2-methoxy-6-polyprenyl-1,4-benzoquinol methylase UbiE [Blattabacterium cuenoti]